MNTTALPVEPILGKRLTVSAKVKGEAIVKAEESWHGGKLMLQIMAPDGDTFHSVPELAGSFD